MILTREPCLSNFSSTGSILRAAVYTVTINSNTTGEWKITKGNNKVTSTYVTQYDPNNTVAHQWFRIENLRNTEYLNELFGNPIEAGELTTINVNQLDDIKYISYYADNKFYIQRILTGCYIKKAGFWSMGDRIQFSNDNKIVTINPIPDGVYDLNTDILYL